MFTAATIHKSFVLPILDYFNTMWGCCGSVNADKFPEQQGAVVNLDYHLTSSNVRKRPFLSWLCNF